MALQLEIFIDDRPARLIGSFTRLPDGRMASRRAELREAGVEVPGSGGPEDQVVLESVPGLAYRYDETLQTIHLNIPTGLRATHEYEGVSAVADGVPVKSATGAVLNYNLFTSALRSTLNPNVSFQGASATLDGRLFSPLGTLSQSAILGSTTSVKMTALRLETAFSYSDPVSLTSYKAGDTISSGLAWTRPVRLGGLQTQRNFGLRPDLVTLPLPSVSGSAAVPSTLDVYVNNVKTFSQEVDPGPYRINNLPLLGGDGTARVVLHDASGHEIEQSLPFFATARLLKPGLTDYSVEAGLPRLFYGVESNIYSKKPVASGSLRRGVFDWLTVEAHAEGGAGLVNAGAGAVTRVFSRAALTVAASASRSGSGTGLQSYGAFETRLWGISLNIASQRTFGTYDDLASVTASVAPKVFGTSVSTGGNADPFAIRTSIRAARAQDRISVSLPLPFDSHSSMGVSLVNQVDTGNKRSQLASVSVSRAMPFNSAAYATAFVDLAHRKQAGVFFGLSAPIGANISASTGFSVGPKGWAATADASRALGRQNGDYGWRVRESEGRGQASSQSAVLSYRSPYGRIEAGATQQRGATQGSAEFEGAVAVLGGGVYAANRINDSFAVVDAGVPNIDVLYENRLIGHTNGAGKLLVPELRSYQRNKLEIDPRGLPINAAAATTQDVIAPADRSGIIVDFKVRTNIQAAVVVLQDRAGKLLVAGTPGTLAGSGEKFVVGYDGRAYISGLAGANTVSVETATGTCTARFAFQARANAQVTIGPVMCL